MSERLQLNSMDAKSFVNRLGIDVAENQHLENLPVFNNRLVCRIKNQDDSSKIIKIRASDDAAKLESDKTRRLMGFYFCDDATVSVWEVEGFQIMLMPDLGKDIGDMALDLDLKKIGYDELNSENAFQGFSCEEASKLVQDFRTMQMDLVRRENLIHGDLFQQRSPNNIVYDYLSDRLYFVDAEALAPVTEERVKWLNLQMQDVESWVMKNLTS